MKRMLIGLILLGLPCSSAHAEPNSTVRWLMNEPASMFDLGMLRLNLHLRELEEVYAFALQNQSWFEGRDTRYVRTSATYSGDENRIYLHFTIAAERELSEENCGQVIEMLRGLTTDDVPSLSYAAYFTHTHYAASDRPDSLEQNILDISVFKVRLTWGTVEAGSAASVACLGRVTGEGYSIQAE